MDDPDEGILAVLDRKKKGIIKKVEMSLKKKFFLLRLRHCFFSLLRLYVHSNLQLVAICMVYFDEEKKAITRETQQIKEGEDIREKK